MKKNKKTLLIIGVISLSLIILLTCLFGSYLIYRIIKKDSAITEEIITEYKISEKVNSDKNNSKNTDSEIMKDDAPELKKDDTQDNNISEKNEVIRAAGVTNINQMDLYDIEQVETFSAGAAKFIIYPLKDISATEQEEGYFEAYQDINLVYSSDKLYNITGIFSFDYNSDTYIVVTSYSGGAHCCFTEYIFHKDTDEKLTLIRELATNNATISPDSFFVKNDNLYLSIMDDRFAYFYTSYASSYSFVQFFQLDEKNLTSTNSPFKDEFLKEASRCEAELNEINPANIYSMEDWFPTLICKSANYWYGEDKNKAWSGFNDYFTKFGASENPNNIRTEMEDILKQPY